MSEEKIRDSGATPWELICAIEEMFRLNIALDVCASANNAKAKKFYTIKDNGLEKSWAVKQGYSKRQVAWCNPPYSKVMPWVEKGLVESEWLMLLKNDPSTKWFQKLVYDRSTLFFFLCPRVQHVPPPGIDYSSNNFPSVLVYRGERLYGYNKANFYDWKQQSLVYDNLRAGIF